MLTCQLQLYAEGGLHNKHTAHAVSAGQGMMSCDGHNTMQISWLGLAIMHA